MSFQKKATLMSPMLDKGPAALYGQTVCTIFFKTDMDVIKKLLPPPLEALGEPYAIAYGGDFEITNSGPGHREVALAFPCVFQGVVGTWAHTVSVDNDMGMLAYRETMGYPKKMANIRAEVSEFDALVVAERYGIEYMHLEAEWNGQLNNPREFEKMEAVLAPPKSEDGKRYGTIYTFKFSPSATGDGFEYEPRVYATPSIKVPLKPGATGACRLTFRHLKHDPVSEVPVREVLGASLSYTDHYLNLNRAKLVATVPGDIFKPYSYYNYDIPEKL